MSPQPEPWDDGLADALALVEATRREDTAGVAALLRHGNPYNTAVTLAKLLAEVVTEQDVSEAWFRRWAKCAARRQ